MAMPIEEFELKQYINHPVSSYSGGIKRRLDIALNLMSDPKILFLDEPTVGMDIQSRNSMWEMMRKIRDDFKTTIFLTTHYLEEAEHLSNTICIIKDGKEVIQGTPFELRAFIKQKSINIGFSNNHKAKKFVPFINEHFPQVNYTLKNNAILFDTISNYSELARINKLLLESEIEFEGIHIIEPTLEDVYLRLTEYEVY